MKNNILKDFAIYVTDKTSIDLLDNQNYIGVDNILPNKQGVVNSNYVPTEGYATRFLRNDILIGNIRPYFKKIWLAKFDGGCSPDVLVIRSKGIIAPAFLYACLSSDHFFTYVMNGAKGSKMPRGDKEHIMRYPVLLPKNSVEIGQLLQNIDSKISLNRSIVSDLELLSKQIYDYWFVQFDFPDDHGRPYKSSGGKMVWNDELKRDIPKGWEVKTLGEIESNIITGKTPSTKEEQYYGGEIPFVTIDDIRGNVYVVNTAKKLTTQGAETQKNKYLPEESLCVTCIATIGLLGFTSARLSQTNQQINSIVFKNNDNKVYLYFALKDYFTNNFGVKTGNTFANMNKEEFSSIRIAYSQDTIKQFSITISNIFERIKFYITENRTLTALRDFLLPMLMNGQVTVGEVKKK